MNSDLSSFITRQRELLHAESNAEFVELLDYYENSSPFNWQKAGVCICNLHLGDLRRAIFGKEALTLTAIPIGAKSQSKESTEDARLLPNSRISVRDKVVIVKQTGKVKSSTNNRINNVNINTNRNQTNQEKEKTSLSRHHHQPQRKQEHHNEDDAERQLNSLNRVTAMIGEEIGVGVISRLNESSVEITLDHHSGSQSEDDLSSNTTNRLDDHSLYSIIQQPDSVTFSRYLSALNSLEKSGVGSSRPLSVLYNSLTPSSSTTIPPPVPFRPTQYAKDAHLNKEQILAIQNALKSNDIFAIHGPPGTGKSSTLVELVFQLILRGERVLVCAASNPATDNLIEKLATSKISTFNPSGANPSSEIKSSQEEEISFTQTIPSFNLCRIGHISRISTAVAHHSVSYLIQNSSLGHSTVLSDLKAEIDSKRQQLHYNRNNGNKNSMNLTKEERRNERKEYVRLSKELKVREKKIVNDIVSSCQVIGCTLTGSVSSIIHSLPQFDTVIIDEAGQALEVACLLSILRCSRRVVLAGDHLQLGPVIKSTQPIEGGLDSTLFERFICSYPLASILLTKQYRMHQSIMDWSSKSLYQNKLEAGSEEIAAHLLCDLPGVKRCRDTEISFLVIDTAGEDMEEDDKDKQEKSNNKFSSFVSDSKSNSAEADLVIEYINKLLSAGVSPSYIGVLSPYNAQVSLLRSKCFELNSSIEVGSIDSFQGREKECIVISLVRSNKSREVGFLKEDRRLNVAITRARRQVCLIGDEETCSSHKFLKQMFEYAINSTNQTVEYTYAKLFREQKDESVPQQYQQPLPQQYQSYHEGVSQLKEQPKQKSFSTEQHKEFKQTISTSSLTNVEIKPSNVNPVNTNAVNIKSSISEYVPDREKSPDSSMSNDDKKNVFVWDEESIEVICKKILDSSSLSSSISSFTFPSSLSASTRLLIHQIAERVGEGGIEHYSKGEGGNRTITIRKNIQRTNDTPQTTDKEVGSAQSIPLNINWTSSSLVIKEPIAPSNDDNRIKESNENSILPAKSSISTLSLHHNQNNGNNHTTFNADDDIDSILSEFKSGVSRCGLTGCSKPLSGVFSSCACLYCHLRYCSAHQNPILHGCADQHKQTRLELDKVRYARSLRLNGNGNGNTTIIGRGSTTLRADEKAQLSAKLAAKTAQAKAAREKKKKSK